MTRPPVTTCGFLVAKRHAPHCTRERRLTEGCWCFLEPYRYTARQWRALRRRAQRERRAIARKWPETAAFEKELIAAVRRWRERMR